MNQIPEDVDDGMRLSRSGRTDPDGKCTARITVPMTEEMHDDIVCRASARRLPKAEYMRIVMEEVLAAEARMEISMSEEMRIALNSMAAQQKMSTPDFVRDRLGRMVMREFASMQQRIAENHDVSRLMNVGGLAA